ncbi:MAG: DNA-3-methyladenine glycosylase I, partial [Mariniphaga sp.]
MCNRCNWAIGNELMTGYHDREWGVPVHDDRKLFEFLVLEGFQAGLSWQIVLNKREAFRHSFDGFEPEIIAGYKDRKLNELLLNKAIIRNKQKIAACVSNARCFLQVQKKFGSFDRYIWNFVDYIPI